MEKTDYITLPEAGKRHGLSGDYLRLLIFRKKLKAVKFGTSWVTTEKWVKECRAKQKSNDGVTHIKRYRPIVRNDSVSDGDRKILPDILLAVGFSFLLGAYVFGAENLLRKGELLLEDLVSGVSAVEHQIARAPAHARTLGAVLGESLEDFFKRGLAYLNGVNPLFNKYSSVADPRGNTQTSLPVSDRFSDLKSPPHGDAPREETISPPQPERAPQGLSDLALTLKITEGELKATQQNFSLTKAGLETDIKALKEELALLKIQVLATAIPVGTPATLPPGAPVVPVDSPALPPASPIGPIIREVI